MRQVIHLSFIGLCCVGSFACQDVRRGAAGDSCTSTNDCRDDLGCVAQVCVSRVVADAGASGCDARHDCGAGLACVANMCQAPSVGMDSSSSRFGGRGESCRATNDCAAGLSCVMDVCQQVTVPLIHSSKSCYRVECATNDDCCAGFVPKDSCAMYKQNCDTDPVFCNTYRSLCECNRDCTNQLCVTTPPGCMSNAECTSMQTPFCTQGKCGQCDKDSACTDPGAKCVDGKCIAACQSDENCALLQKCTDGVCVDSGCRSDRECVFISKNPLSICRDSKCQLPCSADTDCMTSEMATMMSSGMTPGFPICDNGQCVFVGCDSDTECRALLNIASDTSGVRAVCR